MQNNSNIFINKKETNYLKGIAIIFMFIHHFFTIPNFWTESVKSIYSETTLAPFSESFKICVPIFAFLTGYFYFFTKTKNYKYSFKKISDFWINYLSATLLLILLAFALGKYQFNPVTFIAEIFALSRPTMIFCWYVLFYIGVMLILPLFYLCFINYLSIVIFWLWH